MMTMSMAMPQRQLHSPYKHHSQNRSNCSRNNWLVVFGFSVDFHCVLQKLSLWHFTHASYYYTMYCTMNVNYESVRKHVCMLIYTLG